MIVIYLKQWMKGDAYHTPVLTVSLAFLSGIAVYEVLD